MQIDASGNDDVTGTGESDKIVILDDDPAPSVKFTEITSGGSTNEETIADDATSPTFTIGLFDGAGAGTVTGKKLYLFLY